MPVLWWFLPDVVHNERALEPTGAHGWRPDGPHHRNDADHYWHTATVGCPVDEERFLCLPAGLMTTHVSLGFLRSVRHLLLFQLPSQRLSFDEAWDAGCGGRFLMFGTLLTPRA